jgi:hypothetical protein
MYNISCVNNLDTGGKSMIFKERFDLERKEAFEILGQEACIVDFCALYETESVETDHSNKE